MAEDRNTLTNFAAKVRNGGLDRPNLYSVEFFPKFIPQNGSLDTVLLFCEQTELPGYTLDVQPSFTYTNNTRYIPTAVQYNQQYLSFYVDGQMHVKNFFDTWFQLIINREGGSFSFPSIYCTDITIYKLDKDNNRKYKVTLLDAYPVVMESIQLGYGMMGDVSRLPIVFQYTKWKSTLVDDSGEFSTEGSLIDTSTSRISTDGLNSLVSFNTVFDGSQSNVFERFIRLPSISNISNTQVLRV